MRKRHAFSLTEILIVIAIIVLMLGVAMAAFSSLTGSNSIDAASNSISAMLSRARTEAVGVQEPRGILFYLEPKSQRVAMLLVKATPGKFRPQPAPNPPVDVDALTNPRARIWLTVASGDHVMLPNGVSIQFTNDGTPSGERFTGFNTPATAATTIGGVVMFDGYGRLDHSRYGIRMTDFPTDKTGPPNAMAKFLLPDGTTDVTDFAQIPAAPQSSFGFALYHLDELKDKFDRDPNPDPTFNNAAYDTAEANEEAWLNENAMLTLINRYNGTLIKSE